MKTFWISWNSNQGNYAQAGHYQVIQVLLDSDAEPGHMMCDGAGALFLAAQNGHFDTVSLLLEQPGVQVDQPRSDGATPLWIAAQMGQVQIKHHLFSMA